MSITSDLDKGTTLGDADGPDRFIESLGVTVPTFIDPREDLIPDTLTPGTYKRLNYHVPFKMRGEYKVEWLPKVYQDFAWKSFRTDIQGFVLCGGKNRFAAPCAARAVNRSGWCRNHGGALHPADKKISGSTLGPIDESRVEKLDRVQKFMQGLLPIQDLADDEITGQFVRNSDGVPIETGRLGARFQQMLTKELHVRLNRFLMSKTPDMLKIMTEIAESDLVEAADRLKAAIWVAERTMGKNPEVLLLGKTDAPYQSIFEQIETSTRDDYRAIESGSREVVDAEVVIDPEVAEVEFTNDDYSDPSDTDTEVQGVDRNLSDHGIDPNIPVNDPKGYADAVLAQQKANKELRERVARAKRRRFAARAQGVGLKGDIAFAVRFKRYGNNFLACLIAPDRQTQRDLLGSD